MTISSKIDNMNCYIDIEANKSCTALFIRFEEVAVEECSLCECDKIQLKWGGKSSDPICGCAGIILKLWKLCFWSAFWISIGFGCQDLIHDDYYDIEYYDYHSMADFGYIDQENYFDREIKGNKFRLDFLTDFSFSHGGFLVSWECIEQESATTTYFRYVLKRLHTVNAHVFSPTTETTTTETTTTLISTTTTGGIEQTDSCSIAVVLSQDLCNESKQFWKDVTTRELYPRYARQR